MNNKNNGKKNKLISRLIKRRGMQISKNKLLKNNINRKVSNKVKDEQNLKYIYEENLKNKLSDKNYIRNILIKPVKINNEKKKIVENYQKKEKNSEIELKNAWKKRTNQPYKNIIKNDDYKKKISKSEDLIVHKVSEEDKKGVKEELNKHLKQISDHNSELKAIYSTSNEIQHIKKFEYNHKYKFRVRSVTSTHENMKDNRMSELNNEKKEQDENNFKLDSIINDLKKEGILNDEDLK